MTGTYEINGAFTDSLLFFWTALNPTTVSLFLPGMNMGNTGQWTMSNSHFTAHVIDGDPVNVYSYSVKDDGTFSCQMVSDLPEAVRCGRMSNMESSLVPFLEEVISGGVTTYYASRYDANTNAITRLSKTSSSESVAGMNALSDFTFTGTDGMGRLYRALENKTYRIHDLLCAAARAELYDGTTPKSYMEIGCVWTRINDSNVATVPTAQPYDHLAILFGYFDGNGRFRARAGVLKPVPRP